MASVLAKVLAGQALTQVLAVVLTLALTTVVVRISKYPPNPAEHVTFELHDTQPSGQTKALVALAVVLVVFVLLVTA
jgi:hypothetical protein